MFRSCLVLARLAAATISLVSIFPTSAGASDHFRREPNLSRGQCDSCRYSRETNHSLIHYPSVTYWTSGDALDRWDNDSCQPGYSTGLIAPSPWAYRSIAPYAHHYRFSYGESYGWGNCVDCRN